MIIMTYLIWPYFVVISAGLEHVQGIKSIRLEVTLCDFKAYFDTFNSLRLSDTYMSQ